MHGDVVSVGWTASFSHYFLLVLACLDMDMGCSITWRFGQYAPLALMHGDVVSVGRFALILACLE